ncbi:MAG: diaminopimelate decarboxylase [bacterium]
MIKPEKYPGVSINKKGILHFGGADVVRLAEKFGTPLYVMDERIVRDNCKAFRKEFGARYEGKVLVVYATKALSSLAVLRIVADEGLGADASSVGEIHGALRAGFAADKIYFHGNFKKREDLEYALKNHIGRIVIDSREEAELLNSVARRAGKKAAVLLRITPGIEAHTHHMIQTGKIDTKFGVPLAGGEAFHMVKETLQKPHLNFMGFHCHIGSQILDMKPYRLTVEHAVEFMAKIKKQLGIAVREINLGGGFAVRYNSRQRLITKQQAATAIAGTLTSLLKKQGLPFPQLVIEPGRSIVAPAGITLYAVGPVKEIPGVRNYVSVDGGMSDNPRPALYGAEYEALIANRAAAPAGRKYRICGRHCENDILFDNIPLPAPRYGDILAVFTTGAYNYSMSSNYNRFPRPAIVMLSKGKPRLIVERETLDDLYDKDI